MHTPQETDKSRPDRSMSTNLCVDSWISSVNQSCCPNERWSARTYPCWGQRGAVLIFPPLLLPSLNSLFWVIIYLYFFHLYAHVSIPFSVFPSFLTFPFTSSLFLRSPSPPYTLFFIMIPSFPLSLQLSLQMA